MPTTAGSAVRTPLTKDEAAEALGKSRRTIETYAATGKLPCIYVTTKFGRQATFDPGDVARLKAELESPIHRMIEPEPPATPPAPALRSHDPFAGLAAHLAKLSPSNPPPTIGKWLTLDQAHEQSGLPRAWLLAQARAGAPWAINCGTGKKEFWRFRA
jgi:hypothetical protein